MKRIAQIENQYMKKMPAFRPGDTVRVHYKIKEGDKERIQVFQGTVVGRRGSGTSGTFTVRKISAGVGVERVFPLYSPNIDKIERTASGKVNRAKLYYLRDLTGKSTRIREKLMGRGEDASEESSVPSGRSRKSTKLEKSAVEEATVGANKTAGEPSAAESEAEK